MSKLFGVLGTRFQKIKQQWRMLRQLAPNELNRFILEGIITVVVLALSYFGTIFLLGKLIYPDKGSVLEGLRIYERLDLTEQIIAFSRAVFTFLMTIFSIWFIRWRLVRRYRSIELRHLLNELDYIASGHYEHRISDESVGRLGSVAVSINRLVDSTVKAREEERRNEQLKQELITNVSHDIRTPLTSIIGYLNLLEDRQYTTQEEMQHYVHIAYVKAQQMKKLADSLFEYATTQDIHQELLKQSILLERFLMQLAVEYEVDAQKQGMQINVEVNPLQLSVTMDAEKMARVYHNLITNALKYSNATELTLRATQQTDSVILEVVNNGDKIDSQVIDYLFTRFYRGDASRNSQISGSGLGLAIVEEIVKMHEGTITVSSDEEETKFIIKLPK